MTNAIRASSEIWLVTTTNSLSDGLLGSRMVLSMLGGSRSIRKDREKGLVEFTAGLPLFDGE